MLLTKRIRNVVPLQAVLNWAHWITLLVLLVSPSVGAQVQPQGGMRSTTTARSISPTRVKSLKVRIITDQRRGAGTNNAVFFDIGPLAWKLNKRFHNDFETGSDDTYTLRVPDGLTTDDILWLRLHKKGMAGVTGTKDGLFGAWHPKSVTLLVNEVEFKTLRPNHSLNSRCWYWRSTTPDHSDLKLFARSLRINPNAKLGAISKVLGVLTTNIFKENGISGWLSNPVEKECTVLSQIHQHDLLSSICVRGEITARASSTDGFETIDMKVNQIESCPQIKACSNQVLLDSANGFNLPRYIRIENRHTHKRVRVGVVNRICGSLLWDTDHEGWWEIHPRSEKDLPPESSFPH